MVQLTFDVLAVQGLLQSDYHIDPRQFLVEVGLRWKHAARAHAVDDVVQVKVAGRDNIVISAVVELMPGMVLTVQVREEAYESKVNPR